jgi:Peptidase family M28/K319L-like, PKD domain
MLITQLLRAGLWLSICVTLLTAVAPSSGWADALRIESALRRIDRTRIEQDVAALTALDRWVLSADFARATQLVRARFEAAGLDVSLEPFELPGATVNNVVAVLKGSSSRPAIVIGAHYDAIAFPEGDRAPGAEDNASGTAALIELARVLGREQLATEVRFIAFAAEEVGLRGSQHHVAALPAGDPGVQAMFNLDMVGHDPQLTRRLIIDAFGVSRALAGRLARAAERFTTLTTTAGIFSRGRSDHRPFAERGIPALTVAGERWRDYPHYHSAADLPRHVDPGMVAEVARAIAARVMLMTGFKGGDPVAHAGAYVVTAPGEPVTLDAAGSFDPRGRPLRYRWTRIDGPAVETVTSGTTLRFTPGEAGAYRFRLVVSTDDGRSSEPELAAVIVEDPGGCGVSRAALGWPWFAALLALLAATRRGASRSMRGRG